MARRKSEVVEHRQGGMLLFLQLVVHVVLKNLYLRPRRRIFHLVVTARLFLVLLPWHDGLMDWAPVSSAWFTSRTGSLKTMFNPANCIPSLVRSCLYDILGFEMSLVPTRHQWVQTRPQPRDICHNNLTSLPWFWEIFNSPQLHSNEQHCRNNVF